MECLGYSWTMNIVKICEDQVTASLSRCNTLMTDPERNSTVYMFESRTVPFRSSESAQGPCSAETPATVHQLYAIHPGYNRLKFTPVLSTGVLRALQFRFVQRQPSNSIPRGAVNHAIPCRILKTSQVRLLHLSSWLPSRTRHCSRH